MHDNPTPKIIATLAQLFPVFAAEPWEQHQPFKLGIHHDLRATGILTPTELSQMLGSYCSRIMYLRACAVGATRYDLNGKAAGVVIETEAAGSLAKLNAILAKREQRAAAKRNSAAVLKPSPAAPPRRPSGDGLAALRAAAQQRRRVG
jgi:sRNA-binding protein